jgi:hypothetical protein
MVIIYIMLVSVFITFLQKFLLRVLNVGHRPGSCKRILLGSRLLPPGRLLCPSLVNSILVHKVILIFFFCSLGDPCIFQEGEGDLAKYELVCGDL